MNLTANLETRFNFTNTFLKGAAKLADMARIIEEENIVEEEEKMIHMSYVVSSIMQSVAALESEIWNIYNHGPGHHLGSNGLDHRSALLLSKIADSIDRNSTLDKACLILTLLDKSPVNKSKNPFQDMKLVIKLRDELVHYKSKGSLDLEREKVFAGLRSINNTPPKFYTNKSHNFFPHVCLSYNRAKWALDTTSNFIDELYNLLNIQSPLSKNKLPDI
jgi:hypothetical protein